MAINIIQQLNNIQPVGNDLIYVISGSGAGWDGQNVKGFKYYADVNVSGSADKLVTLKAFQEPSTGNKFGVFNIKNILFTTMSSTFQNDTLLSGSAAGTAKLFNLTFGVEFYTSSFGSGQYNEFVHNSSTSSQNIIGLNAAVPYDEYATWNPTQYLLAQTSPSASFLTRSPRTLNTSPDLKQWLYFVTTQSQVAQVNIETYNAVDTRIGHYRFNPNITTLASRIGIGYNQLMSSSNAYISLTGSSTLNLSSSAYYKTYITSGSSQISETFRYNIIDNCNFGRDVYYVYWLNNLGGYDSYKFNLKSISNISLNKQTFKQIPGTLTNTGLYNLNTSDRENKQYFTNFDETLILATGFVTNAEVIWLKSLFTSPEIFIENNGVLKAALIDTTSYEIKKHQNTKIFSLILQFKYSIDGYSQQQ